MHRQQAIANARQVAWDARDEATQAAGRGELGAVEVWHDVADAADDLAEMMANLDRHIADHAR